jgi:hypothetical protein
MGPTINRSRPEGVWLAWPQCRAESSINPIQFRSGFFRRSGVENPRCQPLVQRLAACSAACSVSAYVGRTHAPRNRDVGCGAHASCTAAPGRALPTGHWTGHSPASSAPCSDRGGPGSRARLSLGAVGRAAGARPRPPPRRCTCLADHRARRRRRALLRAPRHAKRPAPPPLTCCTPRSRRVCAPSGSPRREGRRGGLYRSEAADREAAPSPTSGAPLSLVGSLCVLLSPPAASCSPPPGPSACCHLPPATPPPPSPAACVHRTAARRRDGRLDTEARGWQRPDSE